MLALRLFARAFGSHLGAFGIPLAPFGVPWGPFGCPLGPLGLPGGALGHLLDFVENWTSFSEQMGRKSAASAQLQASRNSPPDPPSGAEVAYGPQLATPLPRAGG